MEERVNYKMLWRVIFIGCIISSLNALSEPRCHSHSDCVFVKYCNYKGLERLDWCDEGKTKVCCPKNHRDLGDDYTYGKRDSPYDRYNDRKYNGISKYDLDFYDAGYSGNPLSKEARRLMHGYDEKECGVRKSFYGKISTGYEASLGVTRYGEYPWQVAVLLRIDGKGHDKAYKYICGGTVLNPSLVLTSAHCVKGMQIGKLKVKLGDWNLKGSRGELFPTIERKIRKIILHDYYESSTFKHDLGLLVLSRPVNLRKTPHISPLCLPPKHLKFEEYAKCYIVGWGSDSYKPNYGSNILKVASVSLLKKDCHHKLKKSIPSLSNKFFKNEISCITGSVGKDACVGDGGGAVFCPVSNKEMNVCGKEHRCHEEHYFLTGIISWGSEDCGKDSSVTVITDVGSHLDWIKEKSKPYGGLHYIYDQYEEKYFHEYDHYYGEDYSRHYDYDYDYDYDYVDKYDEYSYYDYGEPDYGYSYGGKYGEYDDFNGHRKRYNRPLNYYSDRDDRYNSYGNDYYNRK